MDFIQNFLNFLNKNDISAANSSEIIADDKRHRYQIAGDKPKSKNGSYQLKIDGDFAVGWAMSFKQGYTHKYHSKSTRKFTPEEKAEYKRKLDAARAKRQRELEEDNQAAAHEATEMWAAAAKSGTHPYLEKKGALLNNARILEDWLLIPVYIDGKITSLQRINAKGDKFFLEHGAIEGGYCPLAKKDEDLSTLVICEGFATGDSIRQASGLPVIVAFNAGNLSHVAKVMRAKYPKSRLIIAADNDQWTTKADGTTWNPGIEKATAAARAVTNAVVIWPDVAPDDENKPTDFNDVGKEQIMRALEKAAITEAATGVYPDNLGDSQPGGGDFEEEPFKVLGHNNGIYYFLPKDGGQIVGLTTSSMASINNLFRLAKLDFWEKDDPEISHKKLAMYKSNMLIARAHRIGVFKPTNVRGVGAWMDEGRKVLHCGDVLVVDNDRVVPHEFKSQYVYPTAFKTIVPGDEVLTNKEANKLRDICSRLSWESPLSGELLAGWCVIAPVCAALKWRPHLWVTGESQSGKSTIMEKIIMPIVGNLAIRFDGGTTEAAIRQRLGYDGRPIIMDEAESETSKDKMIMENVLQLSRRSSNGGSIGKGTSDGAGIDFIARSCFCFSGINPVIKHRADESRITQLILRRSKIENADKFYKELSIDIKSTITKDYGRKMLNRTFKHLDILLDNCEVFANAAAEVLCDRRAADQIGAMLAGLFLLTSTKRVEFQSAVEWIKKHDWKMHTAINEQNDPERLIMHIMTKFIKYEAGKEDTIGNLMKLALEGEEKALMALRKYGIWPRDRYVLISNKSPNLENLLRETPWYNWKRPLGDIPGAEGHDAIQFISGLKHRCTKVPLAAFDIDNFVPLYAEDEELPYE